MSNILIICMFLGIAAYALGLSLSFTTDELYCEELGYKGDLKQWKKYAQSLTDSKPMQKELELMNKERFKTEMYLLYNLTLKDI